MRTADFFNPARFVKVCKKDILESWKTNLLRFVLLYAVLIALFALSDLNWSNVVKTSVNPFLIVYLILGCIYASSVMEKMTTKEKRIAFLMLPASSFEKYLSRLLYSLVLYSLAFFVAFELADYTRIIFGACFNLLIHTRPVSLHEFWTLQSNGQLSLKWFFEALCQYSFFHSCFILGGSIWYKRPLPKTIAALLVMFFLYVMILNWAIDLFWGSQYYFTFPSGTTVVSVDLAACIVWFHVFLMLVALFNWTLAYYRFKEAEVINRIM